MADCSLMLEKALQLIQGATKFDAEQNYSEALRLYTLGIEGLASVLKFERNERITDTIKTKIHEYLNRAEQLKEMTSNNSTLSLVENDLSMEMLPNTPTENPQENQTNLIPVTELMDSESTNNLDLPPMTSNDVELIEIIKVPYGSKGFSYDKIFGNYLKDLSAIQIEDPYIRTTHQVYNLLRFCELVISLNPQKDIKIDLLTSFENDEAKKETDYTCPTISDSVSCSNFVLVTNVSFKIKEGKLLQLIQSLQENRVHLNVAYSENLHDREIRLNTGYIIKIGRGLDIYQRLASPFSIGWYNFDLRPTQETTISIYKKKKIFLN